MIAVESQSLFAEFEVMGARFELWWCVGGEVDGYVGL